MDPSLGGTAIRAASSADADAVAALRLVVTPYQVFTAEALRHSWKAAPDAAHQIVRVAEADGEIVGFARALLDTQTSQTGPANAYVMVHPAYRGRGIADRLYAEAEEHLRDAGASSVHSRGDASATAFAERWGFVRTHELRHSSLDLTAPLPPTPAMADGVTVASFREAGPETVFAVLVATVVDEPGDVRADALDYAEWLQMSWKKPEYDHDAGVIVSVGGEPAAYTAVGVDRTSARMWSDGTGTVPAFRGRGLAKLAKSVALRRAAASGIRTAYTGNDETNYPMLAINGWLGYRPCATQWSYAKAMT